ncbi:helix-turn-helix domain-containing protein [Marmoricola sp. RAF53]|uniref:helix-turn-helix domain-containing protein n=1 Tax=Marmoricola sp. RAF53 TaxID=3233059 RepID=UPI003F99044A
MVKKSKVGMTVETLGGYLREQRVNAGVSLRQLADQAGVSNPYLSQIERGLRRPSAEVLQQLAKALRISAETLYVQAGILTPDDDEVRSVELAVLADPVLTGRQKQALMDVYLSFRAVTLSAASSDAGEDSPTLTVTTTPTEDAQPSDDALANPTEGN